MLKKESSPFMEFINNNFDRVSPTPFLIWFTISLLVWGLSIFGLSVDFIFSNATYLNITYGAVICTFIMLASCMALPFNVVTDKCFNKAYELSKLFSDTAMGAAGFVAVSGLYNEAYKAVGWLLLGITIYVLVGNHVYHSIFNENKGSRRFFRKIDSKSNTRIDDGKIERDIEKTILFFSALVILLVSGGLVYVFSQVHA